MHVVWHSALPSMSDQLKAIRDSDESEKTHARLSLAFVNIRHSQQAHRALNLFDLLSGCRRCRSIVWRHCVISCHTEARRGEFTQQKSAGGKERERERGKRIRRRNSYLWSSHTKSMTHPQSQSGSYNIIERDVWSYDGEGERKKTTHFVVLSRTFEESSVGLLIHLFFANIFQQIFSTSLICGELLANLNYERLLS